MRVISHKGKYPIFKKHLESYIEKSGKKQFLGTSMIFIKMGDSIQQKQVHWIFLPTAALVLELKRDKTVAVAQTLRYMGYVSHKK